MRPDDHIRLMHMLDAANEALGFIFAIGFKIGICG